MQLLRDPLGLDDPPRGSILSIGNFDGVHLGHQAVLEHVVRRAEARSVPSCVMTFDPHPVKLLRPAQAPQLVTTLEQRLELIAGTGIQHALLVPFTHRLARMEAADFVRQVLVDRLQVREVYIGNNFRFGADRRGDVDLLVAMGRELGFDAGAAPVLSRGGDVVSSTRVRRAIGDGRMEEVAETLGRIHFVDGAVLEGKRLGRRLGFPTLNLSVDNELIPANGVYVTAVYIPSFRRTFASVTNIGVRPTIYEGSVVTVESHLLDFTADVYGEAVRLFLLRRLREERQFDSTVQLMAQIRRDVEATRLWFQSRPVEGLELVRP